MHFMYNHNHEAQSFVSMNWFRFGNAINAFGNITIINSCKSNYSNVANIKRQHHQIMATIADRILKFKPMINP